MAALGERIPGFAECGLLAHGISSRRIAALLLPCGDAVQHKGDHRAGLNHLDQPQRAEVGQGGAEGEGADDHAKQQHDIHQANHFGLGFRRRQIGRQRQADGLHRMESRAHQQKSDACAHMADPNRKAGGFAAPGQDQQGEGHDGQTAKLHHGAAENEGNPPPAQGALMGVRLEADECAKWREEKWQRNHHAHKRGWHVKLDDHHAIECAHQQHQSHADRHLKQGQAQQAAERQIGRGDIREGKKPGAKTHPGLHEFEADAIHR